MIFVCSGCTQSIGTTWHYQASRTSLMSHLVINLPQIGAAPYQHCIEGQHCHCQGMADPRIVCCCQKWSNSPKTVSKLLPSCHQAVGCHQPASKLDCFYKCSQVPRKKDPDLENSPALVTSIKSGQHWFFCQLLTRQGDNDQSKSLVEEDLLQLKSKKHFTVPRSSHI